MEEVRARFEGRQAIHLEQGAARVWVSDIRRNSARCSISAEVTEIPTAGFPVGVFHEARMYDPSLRRWSIGCGYLAAFSEHRWDMGYGGWSLFFAPWIVDGIVELAQQFPPDLQPYQRYQEVLKYLQEHKAYEQTQQSRRAVK